MRPNRVATSQMGDAASDQSAPGQRRLIIAAFASLFGTFCAHALLETARDTLFLTHLRVAQLPWLYLTIAALTLVIGGIAPGAGRRRRLPAVAATLLVGAAVTALLGFALARAGSTAVVLLFLWSGVFSVFTITRIWTVLAETIDMTNAKRLFGRLAAGGGLGGVAGAVLARLLLGAGGAPRHLVLAAAAIAAVTALGPALAMRLSATSVASPGPNRPRRRAGRGQLGHVARHPYVARLLLLALLAATVSTLLDYSFKEVVVAHLPADRLPHFLANFHLATSLISLLVQLFGVALLVRAVGVGRVQVVFPVLLLLGVAVTATTGGLAAVVLLRAADTALRGSFHRPTFELLQVPMTDRLRRKAKPVIDAFGQRGGQAIAGVVLLLLLRLSAGPELRWVVAAVLLAVWLVVALGLGRRYVDLLKSSLLHGSPSASIDAPVYADGAARGTLVAALDSPREMEVRAAVDLLAAYGHARLIAPRLLAHPSPAVVQRVIETMAIGTSGPRAGEIFGALDGLLAHGDVGVRKAALLRRAALAPERALFARLAEQSACTTLRGIALVVLVERGWLDVAEAMPALRAAMVNGDSHDRMALAEALAVRPSPRLERILLGLLDAPEPEVLGKVAATLAAVGGDTATGALVTLLGTRAARAPARAALARLGSPAFDKVAGALVDLRQPLAVRANAPRALVEIDPELAMTALLDGLLIEEDGFVRFRILRALNRVRRMHPKLAMDEDILGRAAVAATDSAYRYLAWRTFLQDGAQRLPERRTATWGLLRDLLAEKEQNAVERLFRVLTLRYPGEGFRKLLRTLRMGGRRTRATGRELIANLLTGPARALTLALIDDIGDQEKLSALANAFPAAPPPRAPIYRHLLAAICREEEGGTLASLAAHHAAELDGAAIQARPLSIRVARV